MPITGAPNFKKIEITLMDNGHYQVAVTKTFAPEYGGGEHTFLEAAGTIHSALDVARGMVTVSKAFNPTPASSMKAAAAIDDKCKCAGADLWGHEKDCPKVGGTQ